MSRRCQHHLPYGAPCRLEAAHLGECAPASRYILLPGERSLASWGA